MKLGGNEEEIKKSRQLMLTTSLLVCNEFLEGSVPKLGATEKEDWISH